MLSNNWNGNLYFKAILWLVILGMVAVSLSGCSPAEQTITLADLPIDTEKTNPKIYNPIDYGLPANALLVSSMTLTAEEVLYGSLRAAESCAGTQCWYYNGMLGEYVIYIWDSAMNRAGYSLINLDQGLGKSLEMQMRLGYNSTDMYNLSKFMSDLREMGYVEISSNELPESVNANALREFIRNTPTTVPIWAVLENSFPFVIAFPDLMIYFAPLEGGSS